MDRFLESISLGLIAAFAVGLICIVFTTVAIFIAAIFLCKAAVKLRLIPSHLAKCTSKEDVEKIKVRLNNK